MAKLKAGDEEALEWFIDRYSAYVGTIVSNFLKGSMTYSDIEEVTADVFVTLWKSADRLYPLNLKGYLSRVSRSLSMQKLREQVQELPLDEDILIIDDQSAFDGLAQEEQNQIVRQAVLAMPQPEREIFLRFYYYNQSVNEISVHMQMNANTIKTKLRRGRETLRQHLEFIHIDTENMKVKGGDTNECNQHS
ncbi:MAG: sigma-70 family RNA polymerase sigma factor [Clostridiales bacterium]|nr:sigma-70 family RNA polymerase sigma factor [Clostridiales bacterium]